MIFFPLDNMYTTVMHQENNYRIHMATAKEKHCVGIQCHKKKCEVHKYQKNKPRSAGNMKF